MWFKIIIISRILDHTLTLETCDQSRLQQSQTSGHQLPELLKDQNNAGWWANDQIDDSTFVNGIEFLIKNGILNISCTTLDSTTNEIPEWVKNDAGKWAEGAISEDSFISGIKYLVSNGIIKTVCD